MPFLKGHQYNLGNKWNLGKKMPLEVRLKIGSANKGKKRTPEMLERYSKAKKGIKWSEESKKKMLGNKNSVGRVCSEETRKKMSIAQKARKHFSGYRHTEETKQKMREHYKGNNSTKGVPPWNKGKKYFVIKDRTLLKKDRNKAYDTQYKYWMLEVKKRDKWKCKISDCNCSGRLEAHHILNWRDHPELRYNINNGITLCRFHHPKKRVEEKKLSPYFQELVKQTNIC